MPAVVCAAQIAVYRVGTLCYNQLVFHAIIAEYGVFYG